VTQVGKFIFSAEAMLERTGNRYMVDIAKLANQKAGDAIGRSSRTLTRWRSKEPSGRTSSTRC
jgi:hypothetical protein